MELFPTPMPNIFPIQNGILHNVGQEEGEEVELEAEMPEDNYEEAEEPEEEAYIPPPYATYQDVNKLGDHITDINNLAINLRNASLELANNYIPGVILGAPMVCSHHRNDLPCCKSLSLGRLLTLLYQEVVTSYLLFSVFIFRLCFLSLALE